MADAVKFSHIIWDFNGTLLDDVDVGIKSVNMLLEKRGLPLIDSVERYHALFGFPVIDYYRRLGFDFEAESYASLAVEWVENYRLLSEGCSARAGVVEALGFFKRYGAKQEVLSASESGLLSGQLQKLGILGDFEGVYGSDNIYAHGKEDIARRWRLEVKPRRALFIGDTVQDFAAALSAGAECALVCGGHQSRAALEGCGCPVFDSFAELTDAVAGNLFLDT